MKILNFILSLLVKGNLNIEIFPYGGWKKILEKYDMWGVYPEVLGLLEV